MPTTEQPVQFEGAVRRFVKLVWQQVRHWGVRGGFVVVVAMVIMAYLHIIEEPHYLLLVISGLILISSEQLLESDRQIREQATAIEGIIENASPRLYALHDCVRDFDETLDRIRPGEKVIIEHLGLDLTQAWQYFEPLLRKHGNLTDVDYRLLILTDETAKIEGANQEVRNWSASVRQSLIMIRTEVNAIIKEFRAKKIKFEVRKYWSVPVVHGFRIVSPMKRCYVAICRWKGLDFQKYGWGEPEYQRIIGDHSDIIGRDMLEIYDGYFNYLWKNSDPGFVLSSPMGRQE